MISLQERNARNSSIINFIKRLHTHLSIPLYKSNNRRIMLANYIRYKNLEEDSQVGERREMIHYLYFQIGLFIYKFYISQSLS